MRILFYPYYVGYHSTTQSASAITGVPFSTGASWSDIVYDLAGCTENVGNVIHVEAPSRILKYNRHDSAFTFIMELLDRNGDDYNYVSRFISDRFDYLVVSEANLIRWYAKTKAESEVASVRLRRVADVLEKITIPFCVLGVGMQHPLPEDRREIDQNVTRFLEVCNERATLVGVRGRQTRDWLKAIGIHNNVVVTGCPSFFVYPDNILNINYVPIENAKRIITAGYFRNHEYLYESERLRAVNSVSKLAATDYVFQDDFYEVFNGHEGRFYDEATGKIDTNIAKERLKKFDLKLDNFSGFYHFRNSSAWRAFSGQSDIYIGDRLHCGVVALQAGKPSVLLQHDIRVRELTDLFQLPSIEVGDIEHHGLSRCLEAAYSLDSVERFKTVYSERLAYFKKVIEQAGLVI